MASQAQETVSRASKRRRTSHTTDAEADGNSHASPVVTPEQTQYHEGGQPVPRRAFHRDDVGYHVDMEDWAAETLGAQSQTTHFPLKNHQVLGDMRLTKEESDYLNEVLSAGSATPVKDTDSRDEGDSADKEGETRLEASIWTGYDNFLHCIYGGTKSNL